MTNVRAHTALSAIVALLLLAAHGAHVAAAGDAPIVYEIGSASAFTEGCYPPCRCAIFSVDGVTGSMRLALAESDPLFDWYDVTDVELLVPTDPPRRYLGSGRYRVGGEVALTQQLVLELHSGLDPPQTFDSGLVPGGAGFPGTLDATISVNGMVCFDHVFALEARPAASTATPFQRGDCNADDTVDISDPVAALHYLFDRADRAPACLDACDGDDDGDLNLTDAIFTLNFLFLGGPALPSPLGTCGTDPTADELGCTDYPPCAGGCAEAAKSIAEESAIVGSCSAVVRLDYVSGTLLSWNLVCAEYARVDEETARAAAAADTTISPDARHLGPADPEDVWVFYQSPGDFGGAAVVSARTGRTLFGGTIVWDGRGDIEYPKEWRPASSLGADCEPRDRAAPVRSYDLLEGAEEPTSEEIESVVDTVWGTALPEGLAASGTIFDIVVLRYPRSVGAFDPSSAEWIVIVNAGWLE